MNFDDIKIYLPKYLSNDSYQKLISNLKDFPTTLHDNFYANDADVGLKLLQGDAIDSLPVVNLPDDRIKNAKVMIISNSCDIDISNNRLFSSHICYCPIFKFSKYKDLLLKTFDKSRIE